MISDTVRKAESGRKTDSAQAEPRKEPETGTADSRIVKKAADPAVEKDATLYRVCWASVFSAACGAGDPMPRDLAEFRAENEAEDHPFRRYWLEVYRSGHHTGVPTIRH